MVLSSKCEGGAPVKPVAAQGDDGHCGAVVGLISGVVIGLLALGAGKLVKSPVTPTVKTTA